MDSRQVIDIECRTRGFEKAQQEVEALADAYDGFPPQVQLKNCRHCKINIYVSQTRITEGTEK